jgi:hypothetical protein
MGEGYEIWGKKELPQEILATSLLPVEAQCFISICWQQYGKYTSVILNSI